VAEEGQARGYLPPNVIHWGSARASAHCSRARCPVFGIETWGFPAPPTPSLVGSGVGGSFRASPAHTCDSAVCVCRWVDVDVDARVDAGCLLIHLSLQCWGQREQQQQQQWQQQQRSRNIASNHNGKDTPPDPYRLVPFRTKLKPKPKPDCDSDSDKAKGLGGWRAGWLASRRRKLLRLVGKSSRVRSGFGLYPMCTMCCLHLKISYLSWSPSPQCSPGSSQNNSRV